MNPQLHADITARLERDFGLKERGRYLQQGECPDCGKRELFTNAEAPWMVKCGRDNKCGVQYHVKELFPELFESWSDRYGATEAANSGAPASATPVADAYLRYGRGFDLERIAGWYTQESYFDAKIQAGTATVRFPLAGGFWERLIDKPQRFGKKKARIQYGTRYQGHWWQPPGADLTALEELWIVEGIFDAIALHHHDITAVSAISCNNYPGEALSALAKACAEAGTARPRLVWALDGDAAGARYTLKHVARAKADGWECAAAQIPQRGRGKRDWNDCHQRAELARRDIETYRHHGALLIAESAAAKAILIYHRSGRREFPFTYRGRTYWWKLDWDKFERAVREFGADTADHADSLAPEQRDQALQQCGIVSRIASCRFTPLYYQANRVTDESWYYLRVEFPHDGQAIKATFTPGQLTAAAEFKKRLYGVAPGALWTGSQGQLDALLDETGGIKSVETIDYVGYAPEHDTWVFGDVGVKDGRVYEVTEDDYLEIGRLRLKTLLRQSVELSISTDRSSYRKEWAEMVWRAYGAKGVVATGYWLGTLFVEQIRAMHASYPFLELIGEFAAGKTTLLEFLWKTVGRDHEGADPSKMTHAGRARAFSQVSNLPVVLVESDRGGDGDAKQRQFDFDELKDLFTGGVLRTRGVKNSGNDTYAPRFKGSVVISQNAAVTASDAILSRLIHLRLTTQRQSDETLRIAEELAAMPVEHVSRFALDATTQAKPLLALIAERMPYYRAQLAELPELRTERIRKNHAQMMAAVECLGPAGLQLLPAQAITEAHELLMAMAQERQRAIGADHPVVQEFWEAYDYIEGLKAQTRLNHYAEEQNEIAINLKHFEHEVAEHKLRVPTGADLKRHLRSSKSRRFIAANRSVYSRITNSTVKCWIFAKGTRGDTA